MMLSRGQRHVLLLGLVLINWNTTFDDLVLNLLHEVEELLKGNATVCIWVNVLDELSHFRRISLQTRHNGFQVFDFNVSITLLVKQIEDLTQVLHFIVGEVACAQGGALRVFAFGRFQFLLEVVLLLIVILLLAVLLLPRLWVGTWKRRTSIINRINFCLLLLVVRVCGIIVVSVVEIVLCATDINSL